MKNKIKASKHTLAPKAMLKPISSLRGNVDLLNAYVALSTYDDDTMPTIKSINTQVEDLIAHLKNLEEKQKMLK